VRRCSRIRGF